MIKKDIDFQGRDVMKKITDTTKEVVHAVGETLGEINRPYSFLMLKKFTF